MRKDIFLLGTGSIGLQVLNVFSRNKEKFNLKFLTLSNNIDNNIFILDTYKPKNVYVLPEDDINFYIDKYRDINFFTGFSYLLKKLSKFKGIIVNAFSGLDAYYVFLNSCKKGNIILQANKESIFLFGDEILNKIKKTRMKLIPIDSEIFAMYHLLSKYKRNEINKFIITASGGALRDFLIDDIYDVKKDIVLNHPTWNMSEQITVNSSTLVNKIYEISELHYIFNIDYSKISVIINYESLVHAGLFLNDKRMIFNLSKTTMEHPIELALNNMQISKDSDYSFNIFDLKFREIDYKKYPLFELGLRVLQSNSLLLKILFHLSNEIAVDLFLKEKIKFMEIYNIVNYIINNYKSIDYKEKYNINDIEDIKNKIINELKRGGIL